MCLPLIFFFFFRFSSDFHWWNAQLVCLSWQTSFKLSFLLRTRRTLETYFRNFLVSNYFLLFSICSFSFSFIHFLNGLLSCRRSWRRNLSVVTSWRTTREIFTMMFKVCSWNVVLKCNFKSKKRRKAFYSSIDSISSQISCIHESAYVCQSFTLISAKTKN